VLGDRIGRSRTRPAKPRHQRGNDAVGAIRGCGDLDLDLPKARSHPAAVANRNLVVHNLRKTGAASIEQAHPPANCRQSRDRYELGVPDVRADNPDRGRRRLLGAALKRELIALE